METKETIDVYFNIMASMQLAIRELAKEVAHLTQRYERDRDDMWTIISAISTRLSEIEERLKHNDQ